MMPFPYNDAAFYTNNGWTNPADTPDLAQYYAADYFAAPGGSYFTSTGGAGGTGANSGSQPGGGIVIDLGGVGGGGSPRPPSLNETMTDIVNATERQLQTNLGQWQAQQKSADDAVSRAWQLLDGMVATLRGYGAPGTKSAAERDRRIDPTQLRWDWIAYYIEPIVGAVTSPPPVPGGSVQPGTNGGTYTPPGYIPPMGFVIDPLMIGAALVLLLVLLRD